MSEKQPAGTESGLVEENNRNFQLSDLLHFSYVISDDGLPSIRTTIMNPTLGQPTTDVLVDATNLVAATYDYEFSMDVYRDFSLDLKLIDANGTMSVRVYMKNTGGTYDQVYGYDDNLNTRANLWTVTNGTLTSKISFNNANYDDVKVELVCSGDTNTATLITRRKP